MRGLKFRAWTRQNPPMPWSQKFVAMTGNGEQIIPIGGTFTGVWHVLGDDAEGLIIEQYTGLKDKNGKEIYEGDIVEALIDGVWGTGRNTVSFGKARWRLEVLYNDIRFMDVFKTIGSKSNPDRIYYLFDKELSELEVIGNVHENPELLEEER